MSEGKFEILTHEEAQRFAEQEMEGTFQALANRPRPYPIPRSIGRKNVENAFHTAFELIGGVPRMALWADQNQTEFYKLFSRLLPQQIDAKANVVMQITVPPSKLDDQT